MSEANISDKEGPPARQSIGEKKEEVKPNRHETSDYGSTPQEASLESSPPEKDGSVEFNPTRRFYLAFASLAMLTLMVALDGTSLSVALPVSWLR